MSYLTPNMNLLGITIGTDTGLTIETNQNANTSILDGHNHSSGSGVQINPNGLNINAALPFNGNPATLLQASVYQAQQSLATLLATYVIGPDLYYNDGNGNVVQLTKSGLVNATSSGIASGTATAAFSAGVLVVNAASLTPANIQAGSILIGQNVASSNFLTLAPPSALSGGSYTLTLPTIPAQTNVMTIDSSGNMGSTTWNAVGQNMTSVGANAIGASMTSTGANAVAASVTSVTTTVANLVGTTMTSTGANSVANNRSRPTGSTVAAGGVAISSVITSYSNATSTPTQMGTVTLTISAGNNPIYMTLVPDGSPGTLSLSSTGTSAVGLITLYKDGSPIASTNFGATNITSSASPWTMDFMPGQFNFINITVLGAGTTHTFAVYGSVSSSSTTLTANNLALVAYEL